MRRDTYLTPEAIKKIYRLYHKEQLNVATLSRRFQVHTSTILRVVRKESEIARKALD